MPSDRANRVHNDPTREFGRDGISGLVNPDRAVRAREVSRPTAENQQEASRVLEQLLARATGRRH